MKNFFIFLCLLQAMYAVANSNTSILRIKYEEPVMPYISPRNDCAEISTYMALRYHDKNISIIECSELFKCFPTRPYSFLDIMAILNKFEIYEDNNAI